MMEHGERKSGVGRPVVKVDRKVRIVARYKSIREAAELNYMSKTNVSNRCNGLTKKEYDEQGHTYRWAEDVKHGKK